MKFFLILILMSFFMEGFAQETSDKSHLQKIKNLKLKNVSDLYKLSPFQDVSVIQRRYLPKTYRFELGSSLLGVLNNKFVYAGGLSGRVGGFINERFGFGVDGYVLFSFIKGVSGDLIAGPNDIFPYVGINSKYYGGAYLKWSPIYGKFAFLENKILYFDIFFILGGGMTHVIDSFSSNIKTQIQKVGKEAKSIPLSEPLKPWVPTAWLGIGQTFAINKNVAWVWDLKGRYYFYWLKSDPDQRRSQLELLLSFGMNFYFPGAKYR